MRMVQNIHTTIAKCYVKCTISFDMTAVILEILPLVSNVTRGR